MQRATNHRGNRVRQTAWQAWLDIKRQTAERGRQVQLHNERRLEDRLLGRWLAGTKDSVWRQQQDRGAMAIWSNKLVRKSFRAMQDNRIHEREQADRERQALSDYWNMQAVELLRRLVEAGSRLQGKQEKQSITIMEARRQRALVLAAKIGRKWLVKARGRLST